MSNHSGGYLLNYALYRLVEQGLVERLGKRKVQATVIELVTYAEKKYDCNSGEILEALGKRLGVCAHCLKVAKDVKKDACLKCRVAEGWDDDDEEEDDVTSFSPDRVGLSVSPFLNEMINRISKQREREKR